MHYQKRQTHLSYYNLTHLFIFLVSIPVFHAQHISQILDGQIQAPTALPPAPASAPAALPPAVAPASPPPKESAVAPEEAALTAPAAPAAVPKAAPVANSPSPPAPGAPQAEQPKSEAAATAPPSPIFPPAAPPKLEAAASSAPPFPIASGTAPVRELFVAPTGYAPYPSVSGWYGGGEARNGSAPTVILPRPSVGYVGGGGGGGGKQEAGATAPIAQQAKSGAEKVRLLTSSSAVLLAWKGLSVAIGCMS